MNYPEIERIIGYTFVNKELLDAAFTHSSFVNEHAAIGNERIEFLGDCVLNFIVGERLYNELPDVGEGALSAHRASIVSRAPLSRLVDGLGLIEFLRVGAGVDKSAFSQKAQSDLFEALVGAVYIDGGLSACRSLLDRLFFGKVVPEYDYKSELQQLAAARGLSIEYKTERADGGEFVSSVTVGDRSFGGRGASKHASQIAAAREALCILNNN